VGDVYGRKIATMSSILVMSLTTIGMGLLPENNPSIFVFLILIFLRVLQGLSARGEYSGAGLLLVENTEAKEGYFSGAALTASGLFGAIVATALAVLVSMTNIEKKLWWVLFLVGGSGGLIIFISRGFLQEKVITKIDDKSWRALFSGYKKQLICIIIFGGLMNVPFQILTGFINTYFIALGNFSRFN
jgi:MFS family permease